MRAVIFLSIIALLLATQGLCEEIKEPNVAGQFYPASKKELSQTIDHFLSQAETEDLNGRIIALISPHAGYEYSGQVAAFGYKAIQGHQFETVIIIAPSHFVPFDGISVYDRGFFRTPLGDIQVDSKLASALIREEEKIYFYPAAFEREHSLEVQLPFLQKILVDFKIVPVVMGSPSYENCNILSRALSNVIKDINENILLIASTDMSHYHPYQEAARIDRLTLSFIEEFDIRGLYDKLRWGQVELCGAGPVIATMLFARHRGADSIKILKYANSGDTSGQKDRVVGYTSAILYKRHRQGGQVMLNDLQKKRLLEIARQAIVKYLDAGEKPYIEENDSALTENKGAFVTIKKAGQLRGCIGHILADRPLYKVVQDMAIEAAVGDPRFPPLEKEELDEITLEISALSQLKKIDDINEIQVGTHGILIRKGYRSGLLLPQVATEYGWDKMQFLQHTCLKAGLPQDAWRDAEIYIFSAQVFAEED
jgi:hypothetical protein